MKKVFYIVFFANFAFFSSLCKAEDDIKTLCIRNMRNPEVIITTSYGDIKYDHTKNRRSITRLHKYQHKNVLSGKMLNGLSVFNYVTNVSIKLRKQTLLSGVNCVYPTMVKLNFGAGENPVIYIAREYEEGSCMYNLVLRHEQTHQQINQAVLEYYLPILKQRFLEVVRNNALASKNSDINLTLAQNELKDKYIAAITPILDEIKAETAAEQAKLDSDENYDYEAQICKGK